MNFIKRFRKIFIIQLSLLFLSCSKTTSPNSSNVYIIDSTSQQLTLQIEAVGNNEAEAIYNGEIKAMKMLLFYGVPNSYNKNPFISEVESVSESNFPTYFQDFYNGHYKNFIINNQILSSYKRNGVYSLNMKVTINTTALRKDLENYSIIRKFGL
ncbi:hypothetical protein ACTS9T_08710 [Empedobacter falsenii]